MSLINKRIRKTKNKYIEEEVGTSLPGKNSMKEKITVKIRNNITQMGTDLREYPGEEQGFYFAEKNNCLPLGHIFCWTLFFFTVMAYWAYVKTKDEQILDWL